MEVWTAELLQPPQWIEKATATLLPAAEADRLKGETEVVWRRRVAARAAVRIALARRAGLSPASLRFGRSAEGKPELIGRAAPPELGFSVSHSGELCVIAISEAGPVGVDVEAIRPVRHLEQIAARFGAEDAAEILRVPGQQRLRAFHETWTRREACLKAAGTGLAGGLGPEVEEGWTVIALEPGGDHVGALAVPRMARPVPRSIAPRPLPMRIPA